MSGPEAEIERLRRALDAWGAAGHTLDLWWRDDDLRQPTEALEPLLAMADETGWAPGLAVVPDGMDGEGLAHRLTATGAEVLVHGYAHRNHARPEAKKCEFPASRPLAEMSADALSGLELLRTVFTAKCLSCFVPPWNRIAPVFIKALTGCGYEGLSVYGPRSAVPPAPGLRCANTHIDVIEWRGNRRFIGIEAVCAAITAHLAACRSGAADSLEPCGLLTHHLVMVDADWRALSALAGELAAHEAVRLRAPSDCFRAERKD